MLYAVDAKSTFGEALLSVHQESLIDGFLVNVAFHVDGGLLLLVRINQIADHIERGRIILSIFRQSSSGGTL